MIHYNLEPARLVVDALASGSEKVASTAQYEECCSVNSSPAQKSVATHLRPSADDLLRRFWRRQRQYRARLCGRSGRGRSSSACDQCWFLTSAKAMILLMRLRQKLAEAMNPAVSRSLYAAIASSTRVPSPTSMLAGRESVLGWCMQRPDLFCRMSLWRLGAG